MNFTFTKAACISDQLIWGSRWLYDNIGAFFRRMIKISQHDCTTQSSMVESTPEEDILPRFGDLLDKDKRPLVIDVRDICEMTGIYHCLWFS